MVELKEIYIYPIKSLGGILVKSAVCTEMGFEYDRRMMLADRNGRFVSQREIPKLALLGAELEEGGFRFYDKSNPEKHIIVPFQPLLIASTEVQVWKHKFSAREVASEASAWFSAFAGEPLTLFKMDEDSVRMKSLVKSPGKTRLSMADGYPYLVLSEASLDDLNQRLDEKITIDRFRANIILADAKAYEEEEIDKFLVGQVHFRMIKACARCVMINVDQKTSEKLVEPLKTLSLYKKKGNNVYFGMNAVALSEGEIKVGDRVSNI